MKKIIFGMLIITCMMISSCGGSDENNIGTIGGADGPTTITITNGGEEYTYKQISQEEAKNIMDSEGTYIILDTREQDEYDEGHISGAILIPYTEIEARAEEMIPDKNTKILVYCRSGRRSKIAAQSLAKLGYTDVLEFGGIIDWEYGVVK